MAGESQHRSGGFFWHVFPEECVNPLTDERQRDQAFPIFDQVLAFQDELRYGLAQLQRGNGLLFVEHLA